MGLAPPPIVPHTVMIKKPTFTLTYSFLSLWSTSGLADGGELNITTKNSLVVFTCCVVSCKPLVEITTARGPHHQPVSAQPSFWLEQMKVGQLSVLSILFCSYMLGESVSGYVESVWITIRIFQDDFSSLVFFPCRKKSVLQHFSVRAVLPNHFHPLSL